MKFTAQIAAFLFALALVIPSTAQDDPAEEQPDETVAEEIIEDAAADLPDEEDLSGDSDQPVARDDRDAGDDEVGDSLAEDAASDDTAPTEAAVPEAPVSETSVPDNADSDQAPAEPGAADIQGAQHDEQKMPAGAETFTVQGQPVFSPERSQAIYQNLVDYLNAALPYRFELEPARGFHRYWLAAQRNQGAHVVLEDAHLAAYRVDNHDYSLVASAQQPVTYSLLTAADSLDVSVNDFVGRRIATLPAPSLGYMILADWFDNPMQQPNFESGSQSWEEVLDGLNSGNFDAAVVPYYLRSEDDELQTVLTSGELPGLTLSAAPQVPEDVRAGLLEALEALHENETHGSLLQDPGIDRFQAAKADQYGDLEKLFKRVYTGF